MASLNQSLRGTYFFKKGNFPFFFFFGQGDYCQQYFSICCAC